MATKIKIEIQEGRKKQLYVVEEARYSEARDRIIGFLNNFYKPEALVPEASEGPRFKPEYLPEWLMDYDVNNLSQKEKLFLLVKHDHPNEWVRSQDLVEEYEEIYGESIKLSSLSTYLARYYVEGSMERKGGRAQREYKLMEEVSVGGST